MLFLLEFGALVLFPIPVALVIVALITAAPHKWWRFAISATAASTLASMVLFFVGRLFFDSIGDRLISFYGLQTNWNNVIEGMDGQAGISLILFAGITTGFTRLVCLSAGVAGLNPLLFLFLILVSRSARFFGECAAIKYIGHKVQTFPKRYFRYATITICLALLLATVIIAFLQ